MLEVSTDTLKANLAELFQRVEETGEELVVTDGGRPVVRVVPVRAKRPFADFFGDARVFYYEDILARVVRVVT